MHLRKIASLRLSFQSYKVKMPTNIKDCHTVLFANPSNSIMSPLTANASKTNKKGPGLASQARSSQQLPAAHTKVVFCCMPDVRDLGKQFCSVSLCHPLQHLEPIFFFFFPHLQLRENSVNQAFSPVHARTLALKVSPVGTDVATMKSWPQGNFLRFCYGQVLPRKC